MRRSRAPRRSPRAGKTRGAPAAGAAAAGSCRAVAARADHRRARVHRRSAGAAALFDGKLDTVWQSSSGEPTASWIWIAVPPLAPIDELHIATASWIKELVLVADGKRVVVSLARNVTDAPSGRVMQTVHVHAEHWLLVAPAQPGPIAIAELEAWGRPKPGWLPTGSRELVAVDRGPVAADYPCAGREATCHQLMVPATLDPMWSPPVGWCDVRDPVEGPTVCHVGTEFQQTWVELTVAQESARAEIQVLDVAEALGATDPERAIWFGPREAGWIVMTYSTVDYRSFAIACRPDPRPTCAAPVPAGAPGWLANVDIDPTEDTLVLSTRYGNPPPGALGKKPLDFSLKSDH